MPDCAGYLLILSEWYIQLMTLRCDSNQIVDHPVRTHEDGSLMHIWRQKNKLEAGVLTTWNCSRGLSPRRHKWLRIESDADRRARMYFAQQTCEWSGQRSSNTLNWQCITIFFSMVTTLCGRNTNSRIENHYTGPLETRHTTNWWTERDTQFSFTSITST